MRKAKRRLKFRGFKEESGVRWIVADCQYPYPHFEFAGESIVERHRLRLISVSIHSFEHFRNGPRESNDLFLLKPQSHRAHTSGGSDPKRPGPRLSEGFGFEPNDSTQVQLLVFHERL